MLVVLFCAHMTGIHSEYKLGESSRPSSCICWTIDSRESGLAGRMGSEVKESYGFV
jgi:hypothetical protein